MTNDLKGLGVDAGTANTIINDVKNYKGAKSALNKVSGITSFFGDVLPIIADIGIGVTAA